MGHPYYSAPERSLLWNEKSYDDEAAVAETERGILSPSGFLSSELKI